MGYIETKHGFTMLLKIPKWACFECAAVHDPDLPHDFTAAVYKYVFYDKHGRWPTWTDSMSHCPQAVKDAFTAELENLGIDIEGEQSRQA